MIWINQIVQGVLLGGYYALIACGLSFMYSVMGIINIAHGSFAVLAAFGLFVLADRFGISPFLGLLIILPAMAAVAGRYSGQFWSEAPAPVFSSRSSALSVCRS
jgi:branched-chain amino acid transport system permease protein